MPIDFLITRTICKPQLRRVLLRAVSEVCMWKTLPAENVTYTPMRHAAVVTVAETTRHRNFRPNRAGDDFVIRPYLLQSPFCMWPSCIRTPSPYSSFTTSSSGLRLLTLAPPLPPPPPLPAPRPPWPSPFFGGGLTKAKSTLMVWSRSLVWLAPSIAALASRCVGYSTRT